MLWLVTYPAGLLQGSYIAMLSLVSSSPHPDWPEGGGGRRGGPEGGDLLPGVPGSGLLPHLSRGQGLHGGPSQGCGVLLAGVSGVCVWGCV